MIKCCHLKYATKKPRKLGEERQEGEGGRRDREGRHYKSWYLKQEGKKDKRSQQGTLEAKIISGKDQQMFSPSVEKLHSVFKVFGED